MTDETNQQENPFAGLGLPPTWIPASLGYTLAKLGMQSPSGIVDMHVLILDGPTGRQAFAFGEEEIRALATTILEKTSGLTVTSAMPGAAGPVGLPAQWKDYS